MADHHKLASEPAHQSTAHSSNDSGVQCPFCSEIFRVPVRLDCGHNVCKGCAESISALRLAKTVRVFGSPADEGGKATEGSDASLVECPVCNRFSLSCTPNQSLRALSEKALESASSPPPSITCANEDGKPATNDCLTCDQSFCIDCCTQVHSFPALRGHTIKPVGARAKVNKRSFCSTHNTKELEIYCRDCQTLVCINCAHFGKHKGHDCQPLEDVFERKRAEVKEQVDGCEQLTAKLDKKRSDLRKELEGTVQSLRALRARLIDHFAAIKDRLQHFEVKTLGEIDIVLADVELRGSGHISAFQTVFNRAKGKIPKAQAAISEGSESLDVLLSASLLCRKLQDELDTVNMNSRYPVPITVQLETDHPILANFGVSILPTDDQEATTELSNCSVEKKTLLPLESLLSSRYPGARRWKRIFSSSEQGMNAQNFINCCSNSVPSVLIATTTAGLVFGVISESPWTQGGPNCTGPADCLFVLKADLPSQISVYRSTRPNPQQSYYGYGYFPYPPIVIGAESDVQLFSQHSQCTVQNGRGFELPNGCVLSSLFGSSAVQLNVVECFVTKEGFPPYQSANLFSNSMSIALNTLLGQSGILICGTPLYSSSRDGMSSASFFSKCESSGPTVLLVCLPDRVIGALRSTDWKRDGTQEVDPSAELFVAFSQEWQFRRLPWIRPQKPNNPEDAIIQQNAAMPLPKVESRPFNVIHSPSGPQFGAGDFVLNLDQLSSSSSKLGASFGRSAFPLELIGVENFGPSVVEVRVYSAHIPSAAE